MCGRAIALLTRSIDASPIPAVSREINTAADKDHAFLAQTAALSQARGAVGGQGDTPLGVDHAMPGQAGRTAMQRIADLTRGARPTDETCDLPISGHATRRNPAYHREDAFMRQRRCHGTIMPERAIDRLRCDPDIMKYLTLPCGETVPALGQGTWYLGDDPDRREAEIAALHAGLERGLSLIDTAEMYGQGRSERRVGEAIAGRRDEVFLVSKVLPGNADFDAATAACEASLERLGTDRLDLYLLHWQASVPPEETIHAFERLQADGKIRHYGISNLDLAATQAFADAGGNRMQVNQLLYNLNQRGIEWGLLPWLQKAGIVTMAYSPFDGGSLTSNADLQHFSEQRGITAGQAALAWLLHRSQVIPIPKSGHTQRVAENAAAAAIALADDDLAELDRLFLPPSGPEPLQVY